MARATMTIYRDSPYERFDGDTYTIDFSRKSDGEASGLYCYITPFFGIPVQLHIVICRDGHIAFHKWEFSGNDNNYLHTFARANGVGAYTATPEQIETVNGLWSGRIRFEGLYIAVGRTVQLICPIDLEREEALINKKIFLA